MPKHEPKSKTAAKPAAKGGSAKRTAAVAAARAKRAGAVGAFGTDRQRALRNVAIIAALEAGGSTADVAREFGVSTRTVRAVRERGDGAPSGFDEPPMAIVEDLARAYRRSISAFSAMAFAHVESCPPVALGAMKGADAARERYVDLLERVGKLPRDLTIARGELEMIRIAEQMSEKVVLLEQGEITAAEVGEFFDELLADRDRDALSSLDPPDAQ